MYTKISNRRLKSKSAPGIREAVVEEALQYEDVSAFFEDLLQHGCQSGMIGSLIYYADSVEFYDKNEKEIEDIVERGREAFGYNNRALFIGSLNGAAHVGSMEQEKNLLAWFAFEEVAREMAGELGVDL